MPIVKELQAQYDEQTAILAALKAALPNAAEDDKPEIQGQIELYESALADPAYQDDFDPSRDPTAAEVIVGKVAGLSDPNVRWHAEVKYTEGDVCTHNGTVYRALADVTVGMEPDDVFDEAEDAGDTDSAPTGGWIPADYTPPDADSDA